MRVKVSSRPETFRRAGMAFTRTPREVDVDKKTLAILQGEPMLAVEVLKEEKPSGSAGANDPNKDPNNPNKDNDK